MAEQTTTARKAVLVVDDDRMVLNYLSRVIARFGYAVVVASNATEALGALTIEPNIGFILTDIDMPDMTGLELRSEILKHETWNHIPVALMTGGVGVGIPKGVVVLLKPFDPNQIKCTITTHLGGLCPTGRTLAGTQTNRSHLTPYGRCSPRFCEDSCEKCPKRCSS